MSRGRLVLVVTALTACASVRLPASDANGYLASTRYRRSALETSLVTNDNDYARTRLAHYARDWDALPEWNPPVAPIGRALAPLVISDDARRGEPAALRALGEKAFFRYPVQVIPSLRVALRAPNEYGATNIVRVEGDALAVTCATCHARGDTAGAANGRLDLGRVYLDSGALERGSLREQRYRAWGPGRMDVTTTRGDEPLRIPDLRPIRFQTHLHQDATIVQNDITTLAIRIETLIITSHRATVRPPREIALALATYLWSLADTLGTREPVTAAEERGRAVFTSRCASCHGPPSFSGPPVPLDEIGTDPAVGRSRDRGTGFYRVPSLRGVASRGALLHDASVPSLDAFLAPERATEGHGYGLDLTDTARRDLLDYLQTL